MFRKIRSILVCLAFICSGLAVTGQLPTNLKITHFDGSNGFFSRLVRTFIRDDKGFIWIATSDGLFRYDGYSFRNYIDQSNDTLIHLQKNIFKLAISPDHKIWMGHIKGGISYFDPATGVTKNYPILQKGQPLNGVITMLVADDKNEIWFGIRRKGLWHLDPITGKVTHYENNAQQKTVIVDPDKLQDKNTLSDGLYEKDGNIWLATHDGLYQFNSLTKQLKRLECKQAIKPNFRDDDFTNITKDGDILWLGSWAGGLTKYHTIKKEWRNYKIDPKETQKGTTNIVSGTRIKSKNELWISSNDKGLGIFNKENETFQFYSDDPSHSVDIPSTLCSQIEIDKTNNLWLVHLRGLSRIHFKESNFQFTSVPVTKTDNKEYYYITSVLDDSDRTIIASIFADGLHVINKHNGTRRVYPVKPLQREEQFQAIYKLFKDSKGKIWVVTRDVLYFYDEKSKQLIMADQPYKIQPNSSSNWFYNIAEDKKGDIWITSLGGGLYRYQRETQKFQHYTHDTKNERTIGHNHLTSITVDKYGHVWVGSPSGYLGYYDDNLKGFVKVPLLDQNKKEWTPNVASLLTDRNGNIWVGAEEGLFRLEFINGKPLVKKRFTSKDGLSDDQAISLLEDRAGNIWCTTISALCMVNVQTQKVFNVPMLNDNLKTTAGDALLSEYGDKFHLLTYGGYYTFDPLTLFKKKKDSALAITSMRVNDREYYYREEIQKHKRIELNSDENQFTFEFAVLDFKLIDDHRYAYQLEGFDKSWIISGSRRYASYTNIPGGNYVFKVKLLDGSEDAESNMISIPMHVDAPFYETWWFLVLIVLTISVNLYLFYRLRMKKQKEILLLQTKAQALEKEKTQVQYENLKQHLNPHFLFNSLTSLSSLIRIDQKMAGEFLDGMSKIYRYILKSKDSETVTLRDEIKFIQTFIALQKTRFDKGLVINVNITEENDHYKIVPVTLQNLIENAIKHNIIDEDSPLVIDILIEQDYLIVRNNLQKKSFVETSNKHGLVNLISLYKYLAERPMLAGEDQNSFIVKIPLL